jgi:hypothetical protein
MFVGAGLRPLNSCVACHRPASGWPRLRHKLRRCFRSLDTCVQSGITTVGSGWVVVACSAWLMRACMTTGRRQQVAGQRGNDTDNCASSCQSQQPYRYVMLGLRHVRRWRLWPMPTGPDTDCNDGQQVVRYRVRFLPMMSCIACKCAAVPGLLCARLSTALL